MSGRGRLKYTVALVAVLFAAEVVAELFLFFPARPGPGDGRLRIVDVPKGVGPRALTEILDKAGVVSGPFRFTWWVRLTGQLGRVQAGRFHVPGDATPEQVIEALSGPGVIKGVRVTIPEGFTLTRIAGAMEKAGLATEEQLIAAATDPGLIRELGVPGPTLEGYIFPDTYYFEEGEDVRRVLETMHANFTWRFARLEGGRTSDLRSVVTLASIVQSEARVVDEMPTIAGVYTNRLTSPGFPTRLLQADPTVSYGCEPHVRPRASSCERFGGTLTRAQLADSSNPYNTYRHRGLPPGPICAPGLAALEAALAPAKVPYFYFVAGKGGRHAFSATLAEHNRAVAEYRKGR